MRSRNWKVALHLLAYILQGVAGLLLGFVVVLWLLRGWNLPIPEVIPDDAFEPLTVILTAVVTFAAGRAAGWAAARSPSPSELPTPPPPPPRRPLPFSPQSTGQRTEQGDTMNSAPYSCFVSYSHHDEAFVQQLVNRLRAEGLDVWYASDDVRAGVKLYDQITEAIRRQNKLLIVLSEQSMASEWVTTELRRARREEIETGQRKLFPIRLVDMPALRRWEAFDADAGKDLAVEVREYFIPDFSNWRDSTAFETAVTRLLRDLQEAPATPTP